MRTLQEVAGGDGANMADAEPEEQARGVGLPPRLDTVHKLIHRSLFPSIECKDVFPAPMQAEDIGGFRAIPKRKTGR